VLLEMGLLLSGIVTNFTFEVLCTWFSSHFDFVKKTCFLLKTGPCLKSPQNCTRIKCKQAFFRNICQKITKPFLKKPHQETENASPLLSRHRKKFWKSQKNYTLVKVSKIYTKVCPLHC
jgi:hypothetical protein